MTAINDITEYTNFPESVEKLNLDLDVFNEVEEIHNRFKNII